MSNEEAEPSAPKRSTRELSEELYSTLKRLAESRLRHEAPGATLQPTMLVHEAFLRLCGNNEDSGWDSPGHFFASAARAMRHVLIDRARSRQAVKRGGDWIREAIDLEQIMGEDPISIATELDEALEALQAYDERKSQIVDMKFFAGMSIEEIAKATGVSESSVKRDWKFAKAWLLQRMKNEA
ncbi:MAG: ECF-type sigma factor [Pirellulales bacterium]